MRRQQLTEAQIAALFDPPTEPRELIRHYTLSAGDLAIVHRCRGEHNRLGCALMLCYLRYPGRPLRTGERSPAELTENTPRPNSPTPFVRKPLKTTASPAWPRWSWKNAAGSGSSFRRRGVSNITPLLGSPAWRTEVQAEGLAALIIALGPGEHVMGIGIRERSLDRSTQRRQVAGKCWYSPIVDQAGAALQPFYCGIDRRSGRIGAQFSRRVGGQRFRFSHG